MTSVLAAGNGHVDLPAASLFDTVVIELEAGLEGIAAEALELMRSGVSDRIPREDPVWRRLGDGIRDSLHVEFDAFRDDALPAHLPEADADLIAAAAEIGSLSSLPAVYLSLQRALWEAWLGLVEDFPSLPSAQRRQFLARGPDFFLRYAAFLTDYVGEASQRDVERDGNGDQRRFRAVKGILDGDHSSAPPLDDFDLDRHHLGLIAWGEDPGAAARQLAAALERPLLSVSPLAAEPSCWAWLSGHRALEPAEERLLKDFQPHRGRLALGLEAFGETGFRATHRQAMRASRFALGDRPSVLSYEDVVLEALASENEDDARAFVDHELHGIEDDSETSRRLRETLLAYFASEYNAASAAATLGVHQQTVANRLRAAEERLGHHSIGVRRVELEMALRLRSCLPCEQVD